MFGILTKNTKNGLENAPMNFFPFIFALLKIVN